MNIKAWESVSSRHDESKVKGTDKAKTLRAYYISTYPDDELGLELKRVKIYKALERFIDGEDIYDIMGVGDSLIRERVFDIFCELYGMDYELLYQHWLHGKTETAFLICRYINK